MRLQMLEIDHLSVSKIPKVLPAAVYDPINRLPYSVQKSYVSVIKIQKIIMAFQL